MSMEFGGHRSIKVFLCCANEDKYYREKLEASLSGLRNKISIWHEDKIIGGQDTANETYKYLYTADLILLLISPAFINSNDCDNIMLLALKREKAATARVIPILLHPGDYEDEPFSSLRTLPKNGEAITSWPKLDKAFQDVAVGVRKAVEALLKGDTYQTGTTSQPGPNPTIKLPPLTTDELTTGIQWPPNSILFFSRLRRHGCALILFVLIFVTSGIAILAYVNSQPTTVTLIASNEPLKATYPITAVIGTPDASQHQVQARQISYITPPQSMTVNATGMVQKQGVLATGKLTLYNGKVVPQIVLAGTIFTDSRGVQIVNDVAANIPAANPPLEGQVTVDAHAMNVGVLGNIPALDFNEDCCTSPADQTIFVKNLSPFTGGKDSVGYTFVQQSDIDGAANSLEQSLTQGAHSSLQSQMHPNEAFVALPQCTNKVSSNHVAGDKADSVEVTVMVSCANEVYDKQQAEKIAVNLLEQEKARKLSPSYTLIGLIKPTVVQATVVDANAGTVSLQVQAEGLWVYQFDSTQKQKLAKLIAGKMRQDAIKLLKQQAGVSGVQIPDGVETLPMDPARIIIKAG